MHKPRRNRVLSLSPENVLQEEIRQLRFKIAQISRRLHPGGVLSLDWCFRATGPVETPKVGTSRVFVKTDYIGLCRP